MTSIIHSIHFTDQLSYHNHFQCSLAELGPVVIIVELSGVHRNPDLPEPLILLPSQTRLKNTTTIAMLLSQHSPVYKPGKGNLKSDLCHHYITHSISTSKTSLLMKQAVTTNTLKLISINYSSGKVTRMFLITHKI